MRAIAISGSPREGGNTETLLKHCLSCLSKSGIDGRLVSLRDKSISGCTACGTCRKNKDETCNVRDDFQPIFEEMIKADIIIVGSPVYFGSATPELIALLDRAGYVSRSNGHMFSRKLGGPIAIARRAGHNFTYAQLLYWYMINDMIVPGSTYWNVGIAGALGKINEDQEALDTIERFAENLAWLAEKTTK